MERVSGDRRVDLQVGLANGIAEGMDRRRVLHAARRLHAGGNVNGPGPQRPDSGADISGMQPTRQNEPMGDAARNERPIEDLSAAAPGFDVSVEQKTLGPLETAREV